MKWLDRSLITSPLYYALCLSEKDFHKELKRLKIPRKHWPDFVATRHADATVHFFEQCGDIGACAIVCLGACKKRKPVEIYGLLVHEAVHIYQEIREHIGEKYPSSEFESYVVQKISQELIHAYLERKK